MEPPQMPVLVYGAMGTRGGPVARRLLAEGRPVRVVTRNPARAEAWRRDGAEVVAGDLADRGSLERASAGVDAVFFHLPVIYDVELALGYARNAVAAAAAAGARHLVFEGNTQVPDEPTTVPAFEIERAAEAYLLGSGVPTVVLRPTIYMDNLAGPWTAPGIVDGGVLAYPLPADAEAAWLSADDAAALAIAALKRPDLAGRGFDIGGPETLGGETVAARFAEALDRPVRYEPIPLDDFERGLNAALGAPTGTEITKQYRWYEDQGTTRRVTADMAPVLAELPVRLTPLTEWIRARDWTALAAR